jgi:hypothetical protein
MNQESKSPTEMTQQRIIDKGLDHAWQWFLLHANQRMQAVNFFLVATAFLSAGYVAAIRVPPVAVGVSALGILFSLTFYGFELRIQELLKAGEKALYRAQRCLADETGIAEFNICEAVEIARIPVTKYSKLIRTLYGTTAVAFTAGLAYATSHFSNGDGAPPINSFRIIIVLAAAFSLYLGQRLATRENVTPKWLQIAFAIALVGTGLCLLAVSAIRPFK